MVDTWYLSTEMRKTAKSNTTTHHALALFIISTLAMRLLDIATNISHGEYRDSFSSEIVHCRVEVIMDV